MPGKKLIYKNSYYQTPPHPHPEKHTAEESQSSSQGANNVILDALKAPTHQKHKMTLQAHTIHVMNTHTQASYITCSVT